MVGRMDEAVRVAQNVLRVTKPTVNAYVWYRYHDVDEFLSQVRKIQIQVFQSVVGCMNETVYIIRNVLYFAISYLCLILEL